MTKKKRLTLFAVLGALLAVAGTALALLGRGHGDVTTSSEEAYRLYHRALDAERKLYFKDAVSGYAEALSHDPNFVMAAVRLAGRMAERDPARAKALLSCATACLDGLTAREKLTVEICKADLETHDQKRVGELLDEYIRRFPDDPDMYVKRSAVLMKEGKADEGVALLEKVIRLEPNLSYAYNTLGYSWMARGDFGKAEDYLKRYRFLAPDQANPYDSLGELYANTGRYDEAEESLKRALEIRPDFTASVAHLGVVLAGRGDDAGASARYRQAAEMADNPKEKVEYGFTAAFSLVVAGQGAEALELFDRLTAGAKALPGEDGTRAGPDTTRFRVAILALAGRPDEAEQELAKGLPLPAKASEKDRRNAEQLHLVLEGAIASARRDPAKAVDLLKRGMQPVGASSGGFPMYPYPCWLRVLMARNLVSLSRPVEARAALQEILAVNPRYQPALDLLATLPAAEPGRAGAGTAGTP